jgi:hypothetical protein
MVSVGRWAVMAVTEFVSAGGAAGTRRMVACATVGVDVVVKRFVIVDAAVAPRRGLLNRSETLLVVDMEAVVGESDWLVLRRRVGLVEQTAPRFDR